MEVLEEIMTKFEGEVVKPEVTVTDDKRIRIKFGEIASFLFAIDEAGKFAREIEDRVWDIMSMQQEKLPIHATVRLEEGNPIREYKKKEKK